MATTQERLDALYDRQDITQQLTNYARAVDRHDHALGKAIFHPDAPADYGTMFQGSAHEFIDWCLESQLGLISQSHQFSTITIWLDGDTARSETYGDSTSRWRGADGQIHVRRTLGRYVDRWDRRDGTWRIAARQFVNDMDYGGPVAEADAHQMTGRRDRLDPSYFPE